jgi:hypothetical protein
VVIEERCGHLAPARVVDTDEQDLRDVFHDAPLALPERPKALPREPLRQDRQVGDDPRALHLAIDSSRYRAIVSRRTHP